jgi:cellulose synthase/poly-beta-1,6-N-acetylglucosamine synthase-like glycosyltransferase
MSALETAVVALYFATLLVLAVYGCHRTWLLRQFRRHPAAAAPPTPPPAALPRVTVQLPIYNERYVVTRLIRAACALDYPRDRLDIQVLDDSTDDTTARAAAEIAIQRRRGLDIRHVRRPDRTGFKAGALAHGLRTARGEMIAIFDADFVPPRRFLLDLVGRFADPRVGMVQARWDHLNRDYSLLTRLQAIFLDGHFVIEHAARHRTGCFFNFNGTAGIWRRSCIEDAGGWHDDTLTEDLDLSYRAQVRGWRFDYAGEVSAPAELPADIDAFKSQQRRWAQGSIQTGLKMLPRVWRARLPLRTRLEAFFHLTGNGAYVLMVLLAVLMIPAMRIRRGLDPWTILAIDLPLFLVSTVSIGAFYLASQPRGRRGRAATLALLPLLMALGIGLSVNNSRAALRALRRRRDAFERTPKYRLEGTRGEWRGRRYRGLRQPGVAAAESCLAIYFLAGAADALRAGQYLALPPLLLFLAGFLHVSLLSLGQARKTC